MSRPKYNFLHLDMPSPHEIEHGLITEGDLIAALLANRRLGNNSRPKSDRKHVRIASIEALRNRSSSEESKYDPRIVHISGHASGKGVDLLGETVEWGDLGEALKSWLKELPPISPLKSMASKSQRVLICSFCHSKQAFRSAFYQKPLKKHFSGIYFLNEPKPSFEKTLAIWSMFYLEIDPIHPHADDPKTVGLVKRINDFFDGTPERRSEECDSKKRKPTLDFRPIERIQ